MDDAEHPHRREQERNGKAYSEDLDGQVAGDHRDEPLLVRGAVRMALPLSGAVESRLWRIAHVKLSTRRRRSRSYLTTSIGSGEVGVDRHRVLLSRGSPPDRQAQDLHD